MLEVAVYVLPDRLSRVTPGFQLPATVGSQ
jgi:hypothetical protein